MIEKTITIRCNEGTWTRLVFFLALLHYNGGHSGVFGLVFDGDGSDRLTVEPNPSTLLGEVYSSAPDEDLVRHMVNLAGDAGLDSEYASYGGYTIRATDRDRTSYRVTPDGLYRQPAGMDDWVKVKP